MLSALIGRVRIPGPDRRAPADVRRAPTGGSPTRGTRNIPPAIGVMPREGGNADVRWFDVEPCYVFHPMNAYDEGDTVVLDVVRHPKMFDTERLGPNEGAVRHSTAGPSISPTARCANHASTIAARSSPASTSVWSASGTGTAMRRRSGTA